MREKNHCSKFQKPNITLIKIWYISHKPILPYTPTVSLSTHSHTHTHPYQRYNRLHNVEIPLHYDFLIFWYYNCSKLTLINTYQHSTAA